MMDGKGSTLPGAKESLVEELLRYVRFNEEDARLLRAFRPLAAPHFERIATAFYDRIREHDGAHDVFTGEDQIARLRRSMVRWMDRLCAGPHDEAYFAETAKIGKIHVQIGLPQRYMFSAMALIRIELERVADEAMGENARACREAVSRALDVELAVMLESYRDHFFARLTQRERLERAEVDDALRRTEHRYVNAVELARVMIIGVDRDALVRLFNREAERVTGFGREEILGKPFFDMLVPASIREEQADNSRRALASPAEDGALVAFDSVIQTRAGKASDVRWHVAPAPGKDDDIVSFMFGLDLTDEIARAEHLRQTEKLAAVGTLAAGLAHEIRNPLNGAKLHVTFLERALRKKGAAPDELDAVRIVDDELKRLGALVSEFLDFARPRPLELEPTSIRALCERAAQLLKPAAEEAHALVTLDLPTQDLVLDLDKPKLVQVLLNLLQNAIEAVEPLGGGDVLVRARRKPRHITIDIEDRGVGLKNPDAPIFDPFYSTKPSGTGLGLAIAHRIITDHGGTIDVDSQPGKTIFHVTLPIRLSAFEREPPSEKADQK